MKTSVQIDTLERNRRIMDHDGCVISADGNTVKFELVKGNTIFYLDLEDLKRAVAKLEA